MKPTLKLLAFFLLAGGLLTSCVSSKKYNELLAERDQLSSSLTKTQEMLKDVEDKNKELAASNEELTGEINQIKADLASMQSEIANVKDMVAKKEAELKKVKGEIENAFAPLNQEGLTVRQEGDMFYVSMQEKLLFGSGSAYVNKSGKEILDAMADLLAKNADYAVMVEGHTDDKGIMTDKYPSNWELSVGRAASVVRHLVKKGVEPSRLIASGRGENAPVSSNDTADGRKENRRVEFAIVPAMGGLYKMTKG